MRNRLEKYQHEYGQRFNLEATPAEGAGYRLARCDRKKYPQAEFANTQEVAKGNEPFYTNSSQLPVQATDDVFEALDHQDELQSKYTGGTVQHLFLGERIEDAGAVKNLVRSICERYKLPYFTISPTFSVCSEHGYLSGECYKCPECGAECEVYARVVGYLSPVNRWNAGKHEEFKVRKMFNPSL
jgi:ribonucleoside-triphosphate reductase